MVLKALSRIPLFNVSPNHFRLMKKHIPGYLMILFVILLLIAYVYLKPKEGFECKPTELDTYIQSSEPTMVLFYADWCGHCTKLKPTWEQAATQANIDTTRMIKIDVGGKDPEHKDLMKKYQIDGFPTILVFQNGTPVSYKGERSVDSFLQSLQLNESLG
jgi:thiol:disulfide interchange protein